MKKYYVTLLFTLFASISFAQTEEVAPETSEPVRYYCEVKGYEKSLTSKVKIIFDFGETVSKDVWGCKSKKLTLVDENCKKMKFKSIVDAANFMSKRGWILHQAYSAAYASKKSIKHWIFYKDAATIEEMSDGLMTKKIYIKSK